MKVKYLFLVLLFILCTSKRGFSCDTLKSKDFNVLAEKFKGRMEGQDKFSTQDAVTLVKLYNTLHILAYYQKSKTFADAFTSLFDKHYSEIIFQQLKCIYGKGMTIYSPLYDLYVGIPTTYRCRDHFIVN